MNEDEDKEEDEIECGPLDLNSTASPLKEEHTRAIEIKEESQEVRGWQTKKMILYDTKDS